MRIGELAKATDTQVETIRYYEREALLPLAERTDGNYRVYALVRNLVVFAPGRQVRHEATVGVCRINARMASHFFEVHGVHAIATLLDFCEPAPKPKVAHTAALEALRLEGLRSAGHNTRAIAHSPSGLRSQVQCQDRWFGWGAKPEVRVVSKTST